MKLEFYNLFEANFVIFATLDRIATADTGNIKIFIDIISLQLAQAKIKVKAFY